MIDIRAHLRGHKRNPKPETPGYPMSRGRIQTWNDGQRTSFCYVLKAFAKFRTRKQLQIEWPSSGAAKNHAARMLTENFSKRAKSGDDQIGRFLEFIQSRRVESAAQVGDGQEAMLR